MQTTHGHKMIKSLGLNDICIGIASGVSTSSSEMWGGVVCSVLIVRGLTSIGVHVPFGVAGDSAINCEHLRYCGVPSLVIWGTGEISLLWGYMTEMANDMGQRC